MLRSYRCVFLSHCILAQIVRAEGLAKYFPAAIKPVVQWCLDNDINMIQMPCPETHCSSGGLGRQPHGKKWYEEHGLRDTCKEFAKNQAAYAKQLIDAGANILAFIGMEFSPACATTYLNRGPVIYRAKGIFIEELQIALRNAGLDLPFIGVNQRAHKKLQRDLAQLLISQDTESDKPVRKNLRSKIA